MNESMPSCRVTTLIDVPVHTAFEYFRDPRRIYAGDPMYKVVDAT